MAYKKLYEVDFREEKISDEMYEHFVNVLNAKIIRIKRKDIYRFEIDSDIKDDCVTYLNTYANKRGKKIKVKVTTDLESDTKFNELFEPE